MKISPAVAAYVRPGTPLETRMAGCSAAAFLPSFERVTLLFCLSKDADDSVKSAAIEQLESLPAAVISAYSDSADAHPSVLKMLSGATVANDTSPDNFDQHDVRLEGSEQKETPDEEDDELPKIDDEEYLSKYKMVQLMGISEKIKMALSGDKEWRSILVKDANKLVSGSVIKNPRITEAEVLTLVKSGIQNDEIMRLICANKEWIKNYNIRKALITNNRTPVQNAMRYLDTMGEKDLASFAKSKNISSVIATMSKRILLNKKKG